MPRIDYQSDYLLKSQLDKWWRENFVAPPDISMYVDKLATCKVMINAGLGYALVPARIIADTPEIHRLKISDSQGLVITRKTSMLCNETALHIPIVQRFIDFVRNITF